MLYKLKEEATKENIKIEPVKTESKKHTRKEINHSKVMLGVNVLQSGLCEIFKIEIGESPNKSPEQMKKFAALLGCLKKACDNIKSKNFDFQKYYESCEALGLSMLKEKRK